MFRWGRRWPRLRALFSRGAVDRELDDELDFHLQMETQKGLDRGFDPQEARRQAMVRFGGVERFREEARLARGLGWIDSLGRDLRLSIRMLRRSPVFALAAVGTLALGIGANTAIFSVIDAVLVRPSPFEAPDELVMVWETDRASGTTHEPASWPDVVDFADRSRTLSGVGSMTGMPARLSGAGGTERVNGLAVTPGFLETLGVRPLAGRGFASSDYTTGAPSVALLGEDFWRSRFGSDPEVIGQTLLINDFPVTVIGLLPREADLGIDQIHQRADYSPEFMGGDVAVWFAMRPTEEAFPRFTHPFLTIGRIAEGVELEAAQDDLAAIAAEIEAQYPENSDRGVNLEAYSQVVFGPIRAALLVLLGAVFLVLMVACANVANLLLARGMTRSREVAVRRALGAGEGQIRRQFLVESVVLTSLGTLLGIGLAFGTLEGLLAIAPADVPRLSEARLDSRVLGISVVLGAAVALLFGMLPGLHARGLDLQQSLKAQPGRRATGDARTQRLRSCLIVAEVGLAVMLVLSAGVLVRSLWELSSVDPGFDTAGIVAVGYELPGVRYRTDPAANPSWPDAPETDGFHAALLERVRALPGVEDAAISQFHPLDPGFTNSFVVVGREAESRDYPEIRIRLVSPGYLETLGVALLGGRDVVEGDVAAAPPVGLINRAAAQRYFGSADPIGQELRWWGITRTIVGVIGDERFLGLAAPSAPAVYLPVAQGTPGRVTLLARATGAPSVLLPAIRNEVRQLDPEVPVFGEELVANSLSQSLSSPRFTTALLGLFAGLALLLALIGVHGVLTYSAAQRSAEIGIRMALGAPRRNVIRQVVGEGIGLASLGLVIGVVAAIAGSRLLQSLVYGVTATDPTTYLVVISLVFGAAATASFLPAVRASGADPITTLRAE